MQITKKKEIMKNLAKNDKSRINYHIPYVVCLNFDKLLMPHKKFLWCFVKKQLSQEIGDEMQNVEKLFHE